MLYNKLSNAIRWVLLVFFALIGFFLAQGEYEMIIKPELQNDFPLIKGIGAVGFIGFILLVIGITIVFLLYSIWSNSRE